MAVMRTGQRQQGGRSKLSLLTQLAHGVLPDTPAGQAAAMQATEYAAVRGPDAPAAPRIVAPAPAEPAPPIPAKP